MNGRNLPVERRAKLKARLVKSRNELYKLRTHMLSMGWFTDEAVYQCILSAEHALHGAVQAVPNPVEPVVPIAEHYDPSKAGKSFQPEVHLIGPAPTDTRDLRWRRRSGGPLRV